MSNSELVDKTNKVLRKYDYPEVSGCAEEMLAVSALIKSRPLSQVRFSKLDTNNWKPLLAFRKRLIAGEVAPESSKSSVAPTTEASETTTARGIRKTACRPISAAKTQQILDLEPTDMSVRAIARQLHTQGGTYIEIGLALGI